MWLSVGRGVFGSKAGPWGLGVGWDKGEQDMPGDSREGVGVESIQDLLAVVMRPWDFTSKDERLPRGSVQSGGII